MKLVLFTGLLQIINQERRSWWPNINIIYNKGADLRKMYSETMQAVNMARSAQQPQVYKQIYPCCKGIHGSHCYYYLLP